MHSELYPLYQSYCLVPVIAAINIFLFLYVLALPTSLGFMEMASWVMVMTYIAKLVVSRDFSKLSLPVGSWSLVALAIIVFASAFANQLPGDHFWASVGKFRFIILYFFLHNIFSQPGFPERIYRYAVWAMPLILMTSLYAIAQYFTGFDLLRGDDFYFPPALKHGDVPYRWRSIGWFNMPFTYGYIYASLTMLGIAHLYFLKPKDKRWWYQALVLIFIAISLFTTYTRGVWLAVVPAVLGVTFLINKKHGFYAAALTVLLIGTAVLANKNFSQRITSGDAHSHQSNFERLAIWRMNWEIFKDHPVLGVGYDENSYVIKDYYERFQITGVPASHAHNTYLNYLAGLGIFGLLAFLGFMLTLTWRAFQAFLSAPGDSPIRLFSAGFLGVIAVIAIGGLTECNFKDAEVNHFIIFASAVFSSLRLKLV